MNIEHVEEWFRANGYGSYEITTIDAGVGLNVYSVHVSDMSLGAESAMRSALLRDGFTILAVIREAGITLYIIRSPAPILRYSTKAEAINALLRIANGGLWQLYKLAPTDTRSMVIQRLADYILSED